MKQLSCLFYQVCFLLAALSAADSQILHHELQFLEKTSKDVTVYLPGKDKGSKRFVPARRVMGEERETDSEAGDSISLKASGIERPRAHDSNKKNDEENDRLDDIDLNTVETMHNKGLL